MSLGLSIIYVLVSLSPELTFLCPESLGRITGRGRITFILFSSHSSQDFIKIHFNPIKSLCLVGGKDYVILRKKQGSSSFSCLIL